MNRALNINTYIKNCNFRLTHFYRLKYGHELSFELVHIRKHANSSSPVYLRVSQRTLEFLGQLLFHCSVSHLEIVKIFTVFSRIMNFI